MILPPPLPPNPPHPPPTPPYLPDPPPTSPPLPPPTSPPTSPPYLQGRGGGGDFVRYMALHYWNGFGLLMLTSMCPIISVLLCALLCQGKKLALPR